MKQIIKRYLTKNPKLLAARALKGLVDKLTKSEEAAFKAEFASWKEEWHETICRRSVYKDGSTHYTHRRLRSAMHILNFCMEEYIEYLTEHPHIAVFSDGELKYEIVRQYVGDAEMFDVSVTSKAGVKDTDISLDNMGCVISVFSY